MHQTASITTTRASTVEVWTLVVVVVAVAAFVVETVHLLIVI